MQYWAIMTSQKAQIFWLNPRFRGASVCKCPGNAISSETHLHYGWVTFQPQFCSFRGYYAAKAALKWVFDWFCDKTAINDFGADQVCILHTWFFRQTPQDIWCFPFLNRPTCTCRARAFPLNKAAVSHWYYAERNTARAEQGEITVFCHKRSVKKRKIGHTGLMQIFEKTWHCVTYVIYLLQIIRNSYYRQWRSKKRLKISLILNERYCISSLFSFDYVLNSVGTLRRKAFT